MYDVEDAVLWDLGLGFYFVIAFRISMFLYNHWTLRPHLSGSRVGDRNEKSLNIVLKIVFLRPLIWCIAPSWSVCYKDGTVCYKDCGFNIYWLQKLAWNVLNGSLCRLASDFFVGSVAYDIDYFTQYMLEVSRSMAKIGSCTPQPVKKNGKMANAIAAELNVEMLNGPLLATASLLAAACIVFSLECVASKCSTRRRLTRYKR